MRINNVETAECMAYVSDDCREMHRELNGRLMTKSRYKELSHWVRSFFWRVKNRGIPVGAVR